MSLSFVASAEVSAIRKQLTHPIVDADGHIMEVMPRVLEILGDLAGPQTVSRLLDFEENRRAGGPENERVNGFRHMMSPTLDGMSVALPELLYRRLDEIGLDFTLLFPSYGLVVLTIPDEEIRRATARALNIYYAEVCAGYRDRLEPVAVIPSFTPEEAISELDHAVGELGLKAIVMSGMLPRSVRPDGTMESWHDTLGHDSLYDYDPLWARCVELGVVPAFHGHGHGWGSRTSRSNYTYNHIGHFAVAQEAVCRSLLIGGVPMRFPELRFSFLEGGVTWACQLYSDLLAHYDKRNREALKQAAGRALDEATAMDLLAKLAGATIRPLEPQLREQLGEDIASSRRRAERGPMLDEFAESKISDPEDIVEIFTNRLFFGCEADDPLTTVAFASDLLPHGVRLNAILGSDIGHFDVTDMREVLTEAHELVDHGHLDEKAFRQFTFSNPVRMLTDMNPSFFDGTVIEEAVRDELSTTSRT